MQCYIGSPRRIGASLIFPPDMMDKLQHAENELTTSQAEVESLKRQLEVSLNCHCVSNRSIYLSRSAVRAQPIPGSTPSPEIRKINKRKPKIALTRKI